MSGPTIRGRHFFRLVWDAEMSPRLGCEVYRCECGYRTLRRPEVCPRCQATEQCENNHLSGFGFHTDQEIREGKRWDS